MKNLPLLMFLALLHFSCSSGDKRQQLAELKKQREELDARIGQLEKETAGIESEAGNSAGEVKFVRVIEASPSAFANIIQIQGRVEAEENVGVSSKMAGVVRKIVASPGDQVRTGQLLAELDNDVLVQGMNELKTQLDFANNIYLKQKNLWEQKIGSEIQFLTAKNNKEALEKKMATLNEQLAMSRITSPINGTVDAVDIKVGQSIMPGFPAMRVVNLGKLKVKGEVPEKYSAVVKKGTAVIIRFPDLGSEVNGTISHSASVINPMSRSFSVEAELAGGNSSYRPNMIALLKIVDYKNDKALVVPVNIIQQNEEGYGVFVAERRNGKTFAVKRHVVTGKSYNGQTEILSGLRSGDMVIMEGYNDLAEGQEIKVEE